MKMIKKVKIALSIITLAALIGLNSCSITTPVNATSNPLGTKVGMSKGSVLFGFIYFDIDTSIRTAAKNGGITKISTVDWKVYNVLNFYTEFTCIVTGE